MTDFESLLQSRVGGLYNLHGIAYQLLFSIGFCYEIFSESGNDVSVQLEGLEDVESFGINASHKYVQVKTSGQSWQLHKLKPVLKSFLEVLYVDHKAEFIIVFDFEPKGELNDLAMGSSSPNYNKVRQTLEKYCSQLGATPPQTEHLCENIEFRFETYNNLRTRIETEVQLKLNLTENVAKSYLLALFGQFLEWAKFRKSLTYQQLGEAVDRIGISWAEYSNYSSLANGLIETLSTEQGNNRDDYFQGVHTKPYHIFQGLDVKRKTWLGKIEQGLNLYNTCIIRASSGQGKSSLLYRAVLDNWKPEQIIQINTCELPEHSDSINKYLKTKQLLGQTFIVIIDGAGWKTREWVSIADQCAELGVKMLVSIREEDYNRLVVSKPKNSFIISPLLERNESKAIFNDLKRAGKLHSSIVNSDKALDALGTPPLLMEYIYYLTHGELLKVRLESQVKQMHLHNEDPAKQSLLRIVSLAHCFGHDLQIANLIKTILFKNDIQQVIKELSGEYLHVDGTNISGLHVIRSQHLVDLLHDVYPISDTGIKVLEVTDLQELPLIVDRIMTLDGIDKESILQYLTRRVESEPNSLPSILSGLWRFGEGQCALRNASNFDKVYEGQGDAGIMMTCFASAPVMSATVDTYFSTLQELNPAIPSRSDYIKQFDLLHRGKDICRQFLFEAINAKSFQQLSVRQIGNVLLWCSACSFPLHSYYDIIRLKLANIDWENLTTIEMGNIVTGLYRIDKVEFELWYNSNNRKLQEFTAFKLELYDLTVGEDVSCKAVLTSMEDLKVLREAIATIGCLFPTVNYVNTIPCWFLPGRFVPTSDTGNYRVPSINRVVPFDVERNSEWMRMVEQRYLTDSYFDIQECFSKCRKAALKFLQGVTKNLFNLLREDVSIAKILGGSAISEYYEQLANLPANLPKNAEMLWKHFGMGEVINIQKVLIQVLVEAAKGDTSKSESAFQHARRMVALLPKLHEWTKEFVGLSHDYFNMLTLSKQEVELWENFRDLLLASLNSAKPAQKESMPGFTRRFVADYKRKRASTVAAVLRDSGIQVLEGAICEWDCSNLSITIGVDVPNIFSQYAISELCIEAIKSCCRIEERVILIPICQGLRVSDNSYVLHTHSNSLESMAPRIVEAGILGEFANIPILENKGFRLFQSVYAQMQIVFAYLEKAKFIDERLDTYSGQFVEEWRRKIANDNSRQRENIKEAIDKAIFNPISQADLIESTESTQKLLNFSKLMKRSLDVRLTDNMKESFEALSDISHFAATELAQACFTVDLK